MIILERKVGDKMINVFEGETANDIWKSAVECLHGSGQLTKSRIGDTKEILHSVFSISDPRQKWITSRFPPMNPAFALAELVWIVSGESEASVLNHWNPSLPKYCGNSENYHGAYGHRLRKHFGIDQLERAYYSLVNNPDSRQVVLQLWDSKIDFPDELGRPVSDDIPCNICSILKIRNNRLDWTQVLRSNDIFLGVPYNFVQFTSLQEILAGWLNLKVGAYTQLSDSLHLYLKDDKKMNIQDKNQPKNEDSLSISKEISDELFAELYKNMKLLSRNHATKEDLKQCINLSRDVESYRNIMVIIAADSARRKGWLDVSLELLEKCTNLLYKQMWFSWQKEQNK